MFAHTASMCIMRIAYAHTWFMHTHLESEHQHGPGSVPRTVGLNPMTIVPEWSVAEQGIQTWGRNNRLRMTRAEKRGQLLGRV